VKNKKKVKGFGISLKHTDPKYTKPFSKFGKTLTTTDPMYQIMKMTDAFGPVDKVGLMKLSIIIQTTVYLQNLK
jgi:hypothetical protein